MTGIRPLFSIIQVHHINRPPCPGLGSQPPSSTPCLINPPRVWFRPYSASLKYFLLVQPVKSIYFHSAFKPTHLAPAPALQPNLLPSQALNPSQTRRLTIPSIHSLPACPKTLAHAHPSAWHTFTQSELFIFQDLDQMPPLLGSFPWPVTTRCHFSDPAAPIHLCQCLVGSPYHGHLRLFPPVTL